ncbi:MAG: hypothetical protein LQ341_005428 [Variospora aurantia]|nr:MAG: hypothetical protein LQ341_005428 [Variospora aurantia]
MSAPTARMLEVASAVGAWRARTDPEFPDHDELLKVAAACHYIGAELAFAYEGLQRQTLRRLCQYTDARVVQGVIPLLARPQIQGGDVITKSLVVALPLIVLGLGKARKSIGRGLGKAAGSCRRTFQRYHPYHVPGRRPTAPYSTADESLPLQPTTLEQANPIADRISEALPEQVPEKTTAGLSPVGVSLVCFDAPPTTGLSSVEASSICVEPSSTTIPPSNTPSSTSSSSTSSSSTSLSSTSSSSTSLSSTSLSSTSLSSTTPSTIIQSATKLSEPLSDRPEGASSQVLETITDGDAAAREDAEAVAEALPEDTGASDTVRQESVSVSEAVAEALPEDIGASDIVHQKFLADSRQIPNIQNGFL